MPDRTALLILSTAIACGVPPEEKTEDAAGSPLDTSTPLDDQDDEDTGNPSQDDTDTDTDTTGDDSGDSDTDEPDDTGLDAVDYRQLGPYSTTSTSTTLTASCMAPTVITAPTTAGSWPRLVLAHGFMRGTDQMVGWAEHIASWGVEVVSPSLCHASIAGTDHPQNGADLVTWNEVLGGGDVIYAGHSAGGLAALLAASEDENAIGLIGLDLTDADSIGQSSAPSVDVPTYALAGIPSSCNNSGNGVNTIRAVADSTMIRVTDADHCDFENETDWLCTSFCNNTSSSFSDSQIRDSVLGLFTAATMGLSESDPDATDVWWRPGGSFYEELSAQGALSNL